MTIFFTSDLHFGHTNILAYTDRHHIWNTTEEMNEGLIKNWQETVTDDDSCYILGDVMMGRNVYWESILKRLPGKLYLVKGNHDKKFAKQQYAVDRFEWIKDYHELKVQDKEAPNGKSQLIVLCHYAMQVWPYNHKGSWNLFGHSHSSLDEWCRDRLSIDVGIDGEHTNYRPISYEQVKKVMSKKSIKFVDHHNERTM